MNIKFHFHPIRFNFYGGDVNSFALETNRSVYLIDSSVGSAKAFLIKHLSDAQADIKKLTVLNTHYHWDHASLNGFLKKQYHAEIFAHNRSVSLCDKETQYQIVYGEYQSLHPHAESIHDLYFEEFSFPSLPDFFLQGGEIIEDDGLKLHVLVTPGHTEDSLSFYEETSGMLFVGDAVQGEGFDGNAPFYRDAKAYYESLRKLADLHPKKIFCGHGTVEGETQCAAFLQKSFEWFDRISEATNNALNHDSDISALELSSALAQQFHYPNSVHIYTTAKAHLNALKE